jgi:7-carboxy-7-deazaguanine synthase
MQLILATIAPGEPEIFASIQGEGPSAGEPCAFVRLSRCNLACVWCDTAYTWRFTGDTRPHVDDIAYDRDENQVALPEAEVAARIAALGQFRLVVTGGEPLLQTAALARMLRLLPPVTIVEVETNGTVLPPPALTSLVHQYNVSPKLKHSGNPIEIARNITALQAWSDEPKANFKFVVASPADVAEVRELATALDVAPQRITLMPEGRDSATLRERLPALAQICSQNEFNLSDRLHIHRFGDTRGT